MKSILQLDRETQLDRQRRLLFCWCYAWACEENTANFQWWSTYISHIVEQTVKKFVQCSTSKLAAPCEVSLDLRLAVLSWAIHAEELPEQLKTVPPTHFLGREMYLSHCEQQNAIMHARQELVRHYRFRANNVDKDFTDEEQAAAQEKLRQLSTLPHGL